MAGERRPPAGARATLSGFELTRPAVPETVPAFRHHAATFAAEHGAGPDLVNDVALAVTEAITNAVRYAYGPTGEGSVQLSASAEDGWLTLSIADRGRGFGPGRSNGLGLGLAIIAGLCDDLEIVQEGSGTQVQMRFLAHS
jgi:serine/threonine-protein kinase RsbW